MKIYDSPQTGWYSKNVVFWRNRQFSDGEILEQTGFFRGVDGKWRKEISDDKAEIKPIFASEPLDLYDLIKSGKTTKINVRNSDRAKLVMNDFATNNFKLSLSKA